MDPDIKMVGKRVSHYRIRDQIGRGGMGVIYRAEDEILKREVALKFLPASLTADAEARGRLIREAQVASALDHPSICTVYEIDQTADGQMYIAMAYYPGKTLKQRIALGPVPYGEMLDISVEIAKGLGKAHEKGVIHRDIKPANIIITEDGFIKIVDFGLAILSGQTHITSDEVMAIGTVNYMSPEQIRNEAIDQRTDIWALGLVMQEMITGNYPFQGTHVPSVIYSILNDEPAEISSLEDTPEKLGRIIKKCLKKNVSERYPSMSHLLDDLIRLQRGESPGPLEYSPVRDKRKPSVAVLPFENLSDDKDQEYFCDGITDEIIHTLGHVNGVRVLARATVFTFKHQKVDIQKIGRQLEVERILQGTVRRSGNRLRIYVELIGVADGYTIWSERYDRKNEDVFSIQDDISRSIVENLKGRLLGEERNALERHPGQDIEAYHLYLQGYYFLNKRLGADLRKGMDFFKQAVSRAPFFAPAYVGIADAYVLFAGYEMISPVDAYPLAKEAVMHALELDGSLAWAHAILGIILWEDSRDPKSAEKEFIQAIDLASGLAVLHHSYAEFLSAQGRLEQALVEVNLALELDPLSLISHVLKGFIYYQLRQYDQAIRHYLSVIEMDPNFIPARCELGMTLVKSGKHREAIRSLEKALELSNNNPMYLSRLAYGLGISGDRAQCERIMKQLKGRKKKAYVSPFSFAIAHLGLGNRKEAIDYLEEAFTEKMYHMLLLKTDPLFDAVQPDPRVKKLLGKMGFSPD